MNVQALLTATQLGPYTLKNRIVLPPLTRSRSTQPGNIPNELMAAYYAQRAGAGFMVTEGTQIEPRGQGYAWTPGIHSAEQILGWRKVTEAVHAEGGVIFAQLWHVGRVSHTSLQPQGQSSSVCKRNPRGCRRHPYWRAFAVAVGLPILRVGEEDIAISRKTGVLAR